MQSLNKRITSLFSVILCTFLGMMLILVEPAFAEVTTILEPGESVSIYAKQAYQVSPKIESGCTDPNVYAKLTFKESIKTVFEEIYPIQGHWPLVFNTPIFTDTPPIPNSDGDMGFVTEITSGTIKNISSCGDLELKSDQQLQLLSGFKGKDENDTSGHFVVAKDYYADTGNLAPNKYKYLGSLTSSKGVQIPALGGVAVAQLVIAPNSIRAPHWHLQWVETGYCYQGLGQVGVIVPGSVIPKPDGSGFFEEPRVEEIFIKPQEIFVFPQGSQHYLRNIGTEDDGNLACTLFFADGVPLNEDALLTITLQNLVKSTPLGVLDSVLVMDPKQNSTIPYTSERLTSSPNQTYSSVDQGPDIVKVIEVERGVDPNAPGFIPPS